MQAWGFCALRNVNGGSWRLALVGVALDLKVKATRLLGRVGLLTECLEGTVSRTMKHLGRSNVDKISKLLVRLDN